MTRGLIILLAFCLFLFISIVQAKSIIVANYYNLLLFFPREYGGNDDLRVIFDVRNVTAGTFKYMPVIVDVAYDSELNNAYCYLEGAVTSYIMLLKWSGGNWCYQVLFEFPASQFQKYMYHSVLFDKTHVYWTADRYVMSGRLPGFEKRALLQPSWNHLYSMTMDRENNALYVAGFDYTENALFQCDLGLFTCNKLLTTKFPINSILFNTFTKELYLSTVQGGHEQHFLYRYLPYPDIEERLEPIKTIKKEVANFLFLDKEMTIYTDQKTIRIATSPLMSNESRRAEAKLIDPYALQYVFTFNQVPNSLDTYPYPYFFSDYHDLLYKNNLFLFYFYVCNMDYVENDHVFLPQMDLNNRFIRLENCQVRFLNEREAYVIPSIIAACVALALVVTTITVCLLRSAVCQEQIQLMRARVKTSVLNMDKKRGPARFPTGFDSHKSSYVNNKRDPRIKVPIRTYKTASMTSRQDSAIQSSISRPASPFKSSSYFKGPSITPPPPFSPLSTIYGMNYNTLDSSAVNLTTGQSIQLSTASTTPTNIITTSMYRNKSNIVTPPTLSQSSNVNSSINTNDLVYNPILDDVNTPTFSFTSSAGDGSTSQPSVAGSTNTPLKSSNRVKFNDYRIQHSYDQNESPVANIAEKKAEIEFITPSSGYFTKSDKSTPTTPLDSGSVSKFQFYGGSRIFPLDAAQMSNYSKTVDVSEFTGGLTSPPYE